MEDRFAIDDIAGHDLPDGTIVARNRRTGAQMPLPGEVFNAISYCDAFRTMDEHIAHLAGPNAKGREGEIRQILQSVIDGGLTLSATEICARLAPRAAETTTEVDAAPGTAPAVAAIITCDRPDALSRLLTSMRDHCDLERIERLVVIDDSRSGDSISANEEAIDKARDELLSRGLPAVDHFPPQSAEKLLSSLTKRLAEHAEGVRFLLDREGRNDEVTTGISRNLAQLHAVGRPLLVFDDDVLCSVFDPPESGDGVEFSSRQRGCRFFAADVEWQDYRARAAQCPVQRHLEVLGSRIGECIGILGQERPTPPALEFATPRFARRLDSDNRIVISMCGSYGDPGSAGNEWIALLPVEARAQLAGLAPDVETGAGHRNCWLGRSHPVFEPRANMSQLTGFDNRGYLPPYFPLFRGQDRAFGAMTEFIHPASLTADLPFAIPHLPAPRRSWAECQRGFSLPFTLGHFINDYVTGEIASCGARDPGNRNEWLAMLYSDLADSPRSRIIERAAAHWTQKRIEWLTRLAKGLEPSSGAPPPMGEYMQKLMRQLQASGIRDFGNVEIQGPPAGKQGAELLAFWRNAWRGFSAGLRAWPEVRLAATEILES